MHSDHPHDVESPGIVDRPTPDSGILARVIPLLALALMLLMVVQSCVSTATPPPSASPAQVPASK